jgi:hypothetical protein
VIAPKGGRLASNAPGVLAACAAAVLASALLVWRGSDAYRSVLGVERPIVSTVAVAVLGYAGWRVLVRRSWISSGAGGPEGYRLAASVGLALPIPVVVVDWLGGFGPDINAAFPDALLFYPAIAVVAELVFHVAPLCTAALVAGLLRSEARAWRIVGFSAAVLVEPALQVVWGAEGSPPWANAYVGLHLLAFNAFGVYLMRRYGLLRVILYRFAYYAVWHIGWGWLRMDLLF